MCKCVQVACMWGGERKCKRMRQHETVCLYCTLVCMQCNISFTLVHVYSTVLLPDSNAMLLPGRVPGYKDSDVKLLPSSTTKHTIWELYIQAAAT